VLLIPQGKSNSDIADILINSPQAAGNPITSIFSKLQVADHTKPIIL
jgi:DNA-binding NarL/FixJ family response regulator